MFACGRDEQHDKQGLGRERQSPLEETVATLKGQYQGA